MTEADNIKFSKHKQVKDVGYQKYDNYDAIEVPFTDAIPSDYDGAMGVPISFFNKYNPEQFELIGCSQSWDDTHDLRCRTYPQQTQVTSATESKIVTKLNDAPAIKVDGQQEETYYIVGDENFTSVYKRIFIRQRWL
jgi:hypothetical protein